MIAKEIIVNGKVQGVGFRIFCQQYARLNHIKGYVKNLASMQVKIIAIGEINDMKNFIKKMRKGPNYGWVFNLEITDLTDYENYENFTIKY